MACPTAKRPSARRHWRRRLTFDSCSEVALPKQAVRRLPTSPPATSLAWELRRPAWLKRPFAPKVVTSPGKDQNRQCRSEQRRSNRNWWEGTEHDAFRLKEAAGTQMRL